MDSVVDFFKRLSEPGGWQQIWSTVETWFLRDVAVLANALQLGWIVAAFLLARLLAPRLKAGLERLGGHPRLEWGLKRICRALVPLALPLLWLVMTWIAVPVAVRAGWPHQLLTTAASLLAAWALIRFATQLVRDPAWSRLIAIFAWAVAALNIVGLLDETMTMLNGIGIDIGGLRITVLTVIKGVLLMALLLWLATVASRFLERRIRTLPNLTPSAQVLFGKLFRIVLLTIAVAVALSSVGIDLTAFAVFSGAVGVGLGFGLQKVVSNLISGVILLMDRSIKPGDVISIGDTYGWINTLGARFVSVVTRDGTEYLIPNEELITQPVINWSFSNNAVRLKVPIGVSYKSDMHAVRELCLVAVAEVERVLAEPKPVCLMKGFGDSSVDFELRFWITDPRNGIANVRSEVLFKVWDKFKENGVEIPFPQRDLHFKSAPEK